MINPVRNTVRQLAGRVVFSFLNAGMKFLLCLFTLFLVVSCHYPAPDMSGWDIPQRTKDSLSYLATHHYTLNTNFEVKADSLPLEQLPIKEEFRKVYQGDRVVVAEFMTQPADSIDSLWVKVARDQETQGWIRESELLKHVVPTDSISQFIYLFSDVHATYFLIIFILFTLSFFYVAISKKKVRLVYFNDIDSVFPMLLCVLLAFSATLYGTMQTFLPEMWQHFYFNPSLNPFELPLILGVFVASIWLIIVVSLAVLDDLFHQVSFSTACFYLLGLMSVCIFCYLFFIFTTSYYIGYLFFFLFLLAFIRRMGKGTSYRYRCGNCGAKIRGKGECPNCGAINQ